MKRTLALAVLFLLLFTACKAQPVNGIIMMDSNNLKVIKVWGSHYERGYAYGYLIGDQITTLAQHYVKPVLGTSYSTARNIMTASVDVQIDTLFKVEAQGIIDGMNSAGSNTSNLDATDLLIANSLLDITALVNKKSSMGCSSLMSWGPATAGTDLGGKSVISRHLDWSVNSYLVNNQVMVVHLPSEADEQKWILIGYAGMFSALSGMNVDFACFQHVMSDYNGGTLHNQHLSPVWFTLRKALEKKDFDGDGHHNVQDVRAALGAQSAGFADGYIISALARSTENVDSLIALVAELTPVAPTHTYRYSSFPDSIPSSNLYTANYQIKRNNAMNFCSRYNGIRTHIGSGTLIDLDTNWILMRDYSHLSTNNQFMEYAPEMNYLRISNYRDGHPAYQNTPLVFDIQSLLQDVSGLELVPTGEEKEILYPNPAGDRIMIRGLGDSKITGFTILGANGEQVRNHKGEIPADGIQIGDLPAGMYFLTLRTEKSQKQYKFIKR